MSNLVILDPKGYIGSSEKELILVAGIIMLIVVIPAIIMTVLFAWRYRATNKNAVYTPNWHSSVLIEAFLWLIPTTIIVILSVLVWNYAHKLDPYKPIPGNNDPLEIQVVSLNWKWLFIYPKENIATINEIMLPKNIPVHFYLTSGTVMNSFFIPQLGSQIMTMPAMQTQLHLIADTEGTYAGISANFSGNGFTGMKFNAIVGTNEQYAQWIAAAKKASTQLDHTVYVQLAKDSENNPVQYFSHVQPDLFVKIIKDYSNVW